MRDTTYVPEHKLRQQANAALVATADEAGVTPAGAELHRPGNNDGHPRDKDACFAGS